MSYLERDFVSDFGAWLRNEQRKVLPEERQTHFLFQSMAFEYKCIQKGKRLNFTSGFQPQQLPKLYESKHNCVYKKLSDLDIGLKPYDAFQICYARAYVIVMWYAPREPKVAYWLDIDQVLHLKEQQKSISEEEAMKYSDKKITL